MFDVRVSWVQGVEFARERHAALLAEATQERAVKKALKNHTTQVRARVRFYRMYHLRRILFRLAPGLAERVVL